MSAGPVPHYIGTDRVLVIDFGKRPDPYAEDPARRGPGRPAQVLLGIGGDNPYKHARLSFDRDGKLARSLPPANGEQLPGLYDEDFAWQRHYPKYPIRAVIHCERVYPAADCRDMIKLLEHVTKLAGKSTGPEALVRVGLSSAGVHLVSLGGVQVRRAFSAGFGEPAPRDGLGSCVVLARALLDMLKSTSGDVRLALDPHCRGLKIGEHVNTANLWTVNTEAAPATCTPTGTPVSLKIVPALRRAIVFASEDAARPNVNQVHIAFGDGEVKLTSVDGHNVYRETVPASVGELSGHSLGIPLGVAKRVVMGKDERLDLALGDSHWHWSREGCTIAVPHPGPAFPPAEQMLAQHAQRSSMHETLLAPDHWAMLLDYANKHYTSKASMQEAIMHFGHDCISMAGRSEFVKGRGKKVETTHTAFEAKTFGPKGKQPKGGSYDESTRLALAYFINALEALDETEHLLIKHGRADKYDNVFFIAGARTVLVAPRR